MAHLFPIIFSAFLLAVITFPLGLLVLQSTGLLSRRALLRQWVHYPAAVVLGMALFPLILNLLAVVFPAVLSVPFMALLWLILCGALLVLNTRVPSPTADRTPIPLTDSQQRILMGIMLLVLLLTFPPFLLHDTYLGDGIWRVITFGDWPKHIGVGTALTLTDDLPPINPFLATDDTLRYYYFAYILPARIAHLLPRLLTMSSALFGMAILVAVAFPGTLFFYLREVGLSVRGALFSSGIVTLISGLDFLYVLEVRAAHGIWLNHIDAFANPAERAINAINVMSLWTPQHVLGLEVFILALWLIHHLQQPETASRLVRNSRVILLAMMLAAMLGLSYYTWFGALSALGVYLLIHLTDAFKRRADGSHWYALASAVALSLLISLPLILLLAGREADPFRLGVVPGTDDGLRYGSIFASRIGSGGLGDVYDYPLITLREFGLVLLVGIGGWQLKRRDWSRDAHYRLWTVIVVVSLLIVLFVRTPAGLNDYSMRVAPLAWIVLGCLGGVWWQRRAAHPFWTVIPLRLLLALMLLIGALSTLYEPFIHVFPRFATTFSRNIDLADSYHDLLLWLQNNTEPDAVYQVGEDTPSQSLLYVTRRTGYVAVESMTYASSDEVLHRAQSVLADGQRSEDAATAARAFRSLGVDYVVTTPTADLAARLDPRFADYFVAVYANADYAVYRLSP